MCVQRELQSSQSRSIAAAFQEGVARSANVRRRALLYRYCAARRRSTLLRKLCLNIPRDGKSLRRPVLCVSIPFSLCEFRMRIHSCGVTSAGELSVLVAVANCQMSGTVERLL